MIHRVRDQHGVTTLDPKGARANHEVVAVTHLAVAPQTDLTRAAREHDDGRFGLRRRRVERTLALASRQRHVDDLLT